MALTTPRPMADYSCSQAALYAGLEIAWNSEAELEPEFAAENTIYTPGLSVTKIAAIHAARALPDGQARYAEAEVLRIALAEKQVVAMGRWNSLEGYVRRAFTGAYYKPRIEEAGQDYYARAAAQNWEYVELLMQAGVNFLGVHGAALVADGGMPAGFAASFGTAAAEFEQVYAAFMDARQDAQEETDAKIEANNAIYADGRVMMEDGKHIFRNNASVRERFTWERILALVSTPEYGGSVERSGALAMGQIGNIDIDTVGDGVVEVAASSVGSTMRYYATDNVANGPGMVYLDVPVGTTVTRTVDDFAAVVGLNEVNRFLNVQNVGPVSGEWRVVFGK